MGILTELLSANALSRTAQENVVLPIHIRTCLSLLLHKLQYSSWSLSVLFPYKVFTKERYKCDDFLKIADSNTTHINKALKVLDILEVSLLQHE